MDVVPTGQQLAEAVPNDRHLGGGWESLLHTGVKRGDAALGAPGSPYGIASSQKRPPWASMKEELRRTLPACLKLRQPESPMELGNGRPHPPRGAILGPP